MTAPSSVLTYLAKVVHLMRVAPDDTEAQRRAFMTLVAALEGQEMAIGADVGGMTINGHAVPQGAPFAAELHGQFSAHGIGMITLPADLPTAPLMILLQTLARPRGEIRSTREFVDLLDAQGKQLIAIRGPRDLPPPDQLVTLDPVDSALPDTSFNAPSAESAVGDSSPRPFWQDEGTALDPLREAQVAVDAAVRTEQWLQVLDIMGKIVDEEAGLSDQVQRRRYRRAIQAMAPRRTIEALAELSLQGHRVTVSAILKQVGAESTSVLLELMASAPTIKARREYFTLLSQMQLGTDAIINRLSDDKWFVVRNVAELCGELGLEDAVPRLANHVDHPDPRVRRAVVGALARIGTNQAAEPLRQALHDPEPTVRLQAAQMLDGGKSRGLAMTVALMLDEERHPDVRRELHLALGRIGTSEAIQALIRSSKPGRALFGRKPTAIRVAAVQGLALCNRPEAFAALKELASDRDTEVQRAAREALGAFETKT
jgi:HEAT repeat protein